MSDEKDEDEKDNNEKDNNEKDEDEKDNDEKDNDEKNKDEKDEVEKDKDDDVEYGVFLTPPIIGPVLGVSSSKTASHDKHTGYGKTNEAARADLESKK